MISSCKWNPCLFKGLHAGIFSFQYLARKTLKTLAIKVREPIFSKNDHISHSNACNTPRRSTIFHRRAKKNSRSKWTIRPLYHRSRSTNRTAGSKTKAKELQPQTETYCNFISNYQFWIILINWFMNHRGARSKTKILNNYRFKTNRFIQLISSKVLPTST